MSQNLLRAQCDTLRLVRRNAKRLVIAGEREALHAAQHRRHGLVGSPNDVVLRLLRRQR